MPQEEFQSTIPVFEWVKSFRTLDYAVTVIDIILIVIFVYMMIFHYLNRSLPVTSRILYSHNIHIVMELQK